ncbi:hypothetical protein [Methanothermobacter sp.]|uniref:hypothetical protein n=1 Tax=Methanothermobacter sp. TaxID=1884223 RepID=UPI0026044B4F|nr:hypothetical protein [Methanothermobacter sp.]MDI9617793.1 hypothetical protein [Methanothermobacter sp.]
MGDGILFKDSMIKVYSIGGIFVFYLTFLSIFDSLRDDRSALRHYKKKLHEYQEHEAEVLIDIGVIYLDRGKQRGQWEVLRRPLKTTGKSNFLRASPMPLNSLEIP